MTTYNVWRFVPGDLRLAHGDGRAITPPCRHTIEGEPVLCQRGFHGSLTLRDALATGYPYIHVPRLTSSRIGGTVVHGADKLCGTVLHTDWVATREETERFLRLWAVRCARAVLHLTREQERAVLVSALDVAERYAWGRATAAELTAASDAARAAAWAAAWAASDAACAAAWGAAWAASDAAWGAAWAASDAAWGAAWAAARDAQERDANALFVELFVDGIEVQA